MEINRVWEMPNSRTFQIKSIKEIIEKYSYGVVIDPFANSNKLATITNDLDERYETDYHMDATDFLLMFENESVEWRFCWSHTADGTMTQLLLSKKRRHNNGRYGTETLPVLRKQAVCVENKPQNIHRMPQSNG